MPPVKKVRKTEEYTEPIDLTPQAPPLPSQGVTVSAPVFGDDDYIDPLDEFLLDLEENQGLTLKVESLPQYHVTGKWGKGAMTEYCGELLVGKADLTGHAYMPQIQALYGPGAYRITLLDGGRRFVKQWPVKIAAAAPQPAQQAHNGQPAALIPYRAEPQADPLDALLSQAEKFAKLKKILGNDAPPAAAAPPALPEPAPIAERVAEWAFKAALESKDEARAVSILDRLYPPPDASPSWVDLLKEFAAPLIPVILQAVQNYAASGPGAGGATGAAPALLGATEQPPAAQGAGNGATALHPAVGGTQPAAILNDPAGRFMLTLRGYCVDAVPVAIAGDYVDAWANTEQRAASIGWLMEAPANILTRLGLPQDALMLQWVIDLQADLREGAQDDGQQAAEESAPAG